MSIHVCPNEPRLRLSVFVVGGRGLVVVMGIRMSTGKYSKVRRYVRHRRLYGPHTYADNWVVSNSFDVLI